MRRDLLGHRRAITSASFFAHGTRLVTTSQDGTARVWDVESGRCAAVLEPGLPHARAVRHAAVSPDGGCLVTVGDDYGVRSWETSTGRALALGKLHTARVWQAVFSPAGDVCATVSEDGSVGLWSRDALAGRAPPRRLAGHADGAAAARFLDERTLETRAEAGDVFIWQLGSGELIKHVPPRRRASVEPVMTVELTGPLDAEHTYRTAYDGTVTVVPKGRPDEARVLGAHDDSIDRALVSPDGARLVTCASDGTVAVWNWREGVRRGTRLTHAPPSFELLHAATFNEYAVPFLADGQLYVWSQGRVALLDPATYAVVSAAPLEVGAVVAIAGGIAACERFEKTLTLVQPSTGETVASFALGTGSVIQLRPGQLAWFMVEGEAMTLHLLDVARARRVAALGPMDALARPHVFASPDGLRGFVPAAAPHGWLWDLERHTLVARLAWKQADSNVGAQAVGVGFSPDGGVFIGTNDGHVYAFDARGRTRLELQAAPDSDDPTPVWVSPGGDRVVSGGGTNVHARVWDAQDGRLLGRVFSDQSTGYMNAPVFSPDGAMMMASHRSRPLQRFYRSADATLVTSYDVHRGTSRDVRHRFFAGGRRVITFGSAEDRSVRAWDLTTGERVFACLGLPPDPSGRAQGFMTATVSPDERFAVLGHDAPFLVSVVDLRNGTVCARLGGHGKWARDPVYLGDRLVTASTDGALRVWRLPPP